MVLAARDRQAEGTGRSVDVLELLEKVIDLEHRVKYLEALMRPGGFKRHCKELDLNCAQVVREWFKYHDMLNVKAIEIEMDGYYAPAAIRMAVHRMFHEGELARLGWGIYRYQEPHVRPNVPRVFISQEVVDQIKQDTTHSHGELARMLGISEYAVRRHGHKSPYIWNGGKDGYKRSHTSWTISSQQALA